MQPAVSDEVWAALDPRAGQLAPRARRHLITIVAVAAVLLVGVATLHVEGLLGPRMTLWTSDYTVDAQRPEFEIKVRLSTPGWVADDVRRARISGAKYRLISTSGLPATVPRHGHAVIVLRVAVTDCERPPAASPVLRLEVDQWWGTAWWSSDELVPDLHASSEGSVDVFMNGPAAVACGKRDG